MGERGFRSVAVDDLCRHAEVKKGSFYHFFTSKEHLTLVAIEVSFADAQRAWTEALEGPEAAVVRLRRLARLYPEQAQACARRGDALVGCFFGNLSQELATQNERVREALADAFEGWVELLTPTVAAALLEADRPAEDARGRARSVVAYIQGSVLMAKTRNDPDALSTLEADVIRLVGLDCPLPIPHRGHSSR